MEEKIKEAFDVEAEEAKEAAAEEVKEEATEAPKDKKQEAKDAKKQKARVKELEKELEATKAKLAESEDKYLRLAAEYENFRKRSKTERE